MKKQFVLIAVTRLDGEPVAVLPRFFDDQESADHFRSGLEEFLNGINPAILVKNMILVSNAKNLLDL